jgi:RNA polymerase sigma-70 factor (ECF subfamily)
MAERNDRSTGERMPQSNVEDLVRRAQSGSSAAFGELVERFESSLYNFILRRVASPEDAEEVTQDAFLRAWRKLDGYDPRWSFATWLFTIARHLAATRRRVASTKPAIAESSDGTVDDLAAREHTRDDLDRGDERGGAWSIADRVLGVDQRSALWLRYAEDLTVGEIAEVLGRSTVSVRVLLFRARATLARSLASGEREPRTTPTRNGSRLRKVGT